MKPRNTLTKASALLLAAARMSSAMSLDLQDQSNVRNVLSTLAYDMMKYYHGNETGQTPGLLPGPCASLECYYWWEAGAMFGSLINYWQYTGDTSYNAVVSQAIQFQKGERNNFNPANQSSNMGNDDQAFWAFSAMDAAEAGFPDPPSDKPSWLSLADAVFNFQASEWDDATCGGGLRWQVYSFGKGYNLKNSISDGGFFQLAARLAHYTGNQTFADWANKMYDWMAQSPLMELKDESMIIWDNTDVNNNCTDVDHFVWTYNAGTMLAGSAYMYSLTNGAEPWGTRITQIFNGAQMYFFPQDYGGNVMTEIQCEEKSNCNNDQSSFKAYLSRWMAVTAQLAPFMADRIMPKLEASANGAAAQCVGGDNGRKCGRRWYSNVWDGTQGVGQQMAALSVIGATQITQDMKPKTGETGGTSTTNASFESSTYDGDGPRPFKPITTADKAGAAILTILTVGATITAATLMVLD